MTLFDLESDPLETTNLASQYPSIISEMEQSLSEITSISENDENSDELSEQEYTKTKNELKKLGYI